MGPLGATELIIIFFVVLLLFGAKKLPELARGLGKGITEFKNAVETGKKEIMDYYMRDVPLGRFNDPDDIASMVIFLSSSGARNITGQSFNVDGGLIPS